MTNMRIERDCLGEMEIPNDRYYGIQTIRNMKYREQQAFPSLPILICTKHSAKSKRPVPKRMPKSAL